MTTANIESTNNKTDAPRLPGIYELARARLTEHCDGFLYGDPVWVASAWKHLLNGLPEEPNFEGEGASWLFDKIIEDVGDEAAFSGSDDDDESNGRTETCIELARAYGSKDWPRLAMRDYLLAFEGYDEAKAAATARRMWQNARILYDNRKFADGKPEKAA